MILLPDAPDIRATLLWGYPYRESNDYDDYFDYIEENDDVEAENDE